MQREYAYASVGVPTTREETRKASEYRESPNNIYYGHMSTRDRDALARKTAGAIWQEG